MARKKADEEELTAPIIVATKDYDQFTPHEVRDVSENKFNKLLEAVKEQDLLRYYPVVASAPDKKGQRDIIDGNLRLEVARELERPLYFMEGKDVTSADLARAIGRMDKWTLFEYLHYWTAEDSQSHHTALMFMGQHGAITAVTAVQLLTGSVRRNMGVEVNCRKGILDITDPVWAEEVCTEVEFLLEHADHLYPTQALFKAFALLYSNPQFTLRLWHQKMPNQAKLFTPQRTLGDHFHMLRKAYNVGRTWSDQIADKDFRRKDLMPSSLQGASLKPVTKPTV